MIVHGFHKASGTVALTPQELDDLWLIRRITEQGDIVTSRTSRAIKLKGTYTRPDKGQRVSVTISLEIETISFDGVLGRLRLAGKILESSHELITIGTHHSIIIPLDDRFDLKKRSWTTLYSKIIREGHSPQKVLLISIDRLEAGVGSLSGTRLHLYPSIKSGLGGKMYGKDKISWKTFFEKIYYVLKQGGLEDLHIIIMGPGPTKSLFHKFLEERRLGTKITVVDGIDSSGEDGIFISLKSEKTREAIGDVKMNQVYDVLEEVVKRLGRDDDRIAIGFREVEKAASRSSVENVLISDKILEMERIQEQKLVDLVNNIESQGGKSFLIDHSTPIGEQASRLGGILALLRFSPNR
ncbi:MAG: hypothetical protein ACE5KG_05420 [Nitrososphaerales archaeon]